MNTSELKKFWSDRYAENRTGWDLGAPSLPLKTYFDQLENRELKILIPGAGNSYEAEYLFNKGFKNVWVLDIAKAPLEALQKRVPEFPSDQLIQENFFLHEETYDLIIEQTFFCSFEPSTENRKTYATKMSELLKPQGKLVGLWFDLPLKDGGGRPFGGTKESYLELLSPHLRNQTFEACYNSTESRKGQELFGIFHKK